MRLRGAIALRDVAGKKDDDGVEVGACQAIRPLTRIIGPNVAEAMLPMCYQPADSPTPLRGRRGPGTGRRRACAVFSRLA